MKKEYEELLRKYDEGIILMALSHSLNIAKSMISEESINQEYEKMKREEINNEKGTLSLISPEYSKTIMECAMEFLNLDLDSTILFIKDKCTSIYEAVEQESSEMESMKILLNSNENNIDENIMSFNSISKNYKIISLEGNIYNTFHIFSLEDNQVVATVNDVNSLCNEVATQIGFTEEDLLFALSDQEQEDIEME